MQSRSLIFLFWLFISFLGINWLFATSSDNNNKKEVKRHAPTKEELEAENQRRNANSKKVILERAEALSFNYMINPDAQILTGNVVFRHEGMVMYCDSALFYDKTNTFEAFNNIRMNQGDTLFAYGDYLHYDGNTRLARFRNHVKMENREVTLLTDSLNYDRNISIGYYFEGGMVVDPDNELKSWYGQYSPDTKIARFSDHVVLTNEKFVLTSDTLVYLTDTRTALIVSPAVIVADSGTIHSSKGSYNTLQEEAILLNRSLITTKDNSTLTGDSIHYDKKAGIAKVYRNMVSIDSIRKMTITGHFGYYDENKEYTYATDSACLVDHSQKDTLYMHADTLKAEKDSSFRVMRGIHNVRFYQEGSQGVCGRFVYTEKDSTLRLFNNPVLWSENYQISGDEMKAYFNDSTIEWTYVEGNAFAIAHVDSSYYNQLSGKELTTFFKEGDIHQVDVSGNVLTIFFPQESDSTIVGLNHTESSYLRMFLKERKLDKLSIWPSPKASLTPLEQVKTENLHLPNFRWLEYLRPKDRNDIFRSITIKKEDEQVVKKRRVR